MQSIKEFFTRLTHDNSASIQAKYTAGTGEYAFLSFGRSTAYSVDRKRDLVKNIISATVQSGDEQPLYITADDINVLIEACKVCAANGMKYAYSMDVAHIINPVIASFNQSANKQAYMIVGAKPTVKAEPKQEAKQPIPFLFRGDLSFIKEEKTLEPVISFVQEPKQVANDQQVKQPILFQRLSSFIRNQPNTQLGPVISFKQSPASSPEKPPASFGGTINAPEQTKGLYKVKNYIRF